MSISIHQHFRGVLSHARAAGWHPAVSSARPSEGPGFYRAGQRNPSTQFHIAEQLLTCKSQVLQNAALARTCWKAPPPSVSSVLLRERMTASSEGRAEAQGVFVVNLADERTHVELILLLQVQLHA